MEGRVQECGYSVSNSKWCSSLNLSSAPHNYLKSSLPQMYLFLFLCDPGPFVVSVSSVAIGFTYQTRPDLNWPRAGYQYCPRPHCKGPVPYHLRPYLKIDRTGTLVDPALYCISIKYNTIQFKLGFIITVQCSRLGMKEVAGWAVALAQ